MPGAAAPGKYPVNYLIVLITRRRLILILIRLSSFIKIATTTVIIWLLNKRHKAIAFYLSSLVSLLCQRVESSLPFQTSL